MNSMNSILPNDGPNTTGGEGNGGKTRTLLRVKRRRPPPTSPITDRWPTNSSAANYPPQVSQYPHQTQHSQNSQQNQHCQYPDQTPNPLYRGYRTASSSSLTNGTNATNATIATNATTATDVTVPTSNRRVMCDDNNGGDGSGDGGCIAMNETDEFNGAGRFNAYNSETPDLIRLTVSYHPKMPMERRSKRRKLISEREKEEEIALVRRLSSSMSLRSNPNTNLNQSYQSNQSDMNNSGLNGRNGNNSNIDNGQIFHTPGRSCSSINNLNVPPNNNNSIGTISTSMEDDDEDRTPPPPLSLHCVGHCGGCRGNHCDGGKVMRADQHPFSAQPAQPSQLGGQVRQSRGLTIVNSPFMRSKKYTNPHEYVYSDRIEHARRTAERMAPLESQQSQTSHHLQLPRETQYERHELPPQSHPSHCPSQAPMKPNRTVIFRKMTDLRKCLDPVGNMDRDSTMATAATTTTTATATTLMTTTTTPGESTKEGGSINGKGSSKEAIPYDKDLWTSKGEEQSKWLRVVDVLLEEDDGDVTNDANGGNGANSGDGIVEEGNCQRIRRMHPRPLDDETNEMEDKTNTKFTSKASESHRLDGTPEGSGGSRNRGSSGGSGRNAKRRKLGLVVEQSHVVLESEFWNWLTNFEKGGGDNSSSGAVCGADNTNGGGSGAGNGAIGELTRLTGLPDTLSGMTVNNKNNNFMMDPQVSQLMNCSLATLHNQGGGTIAPHLAFIKLDHRLEAGRDGSDGGKKGGGMECLLNWQFSGADNDTTNITMGDDDTKNKENSRNSRGKKYTVLHYAAQWGDASGLHQALELGANPTIINEEGKTALVLAKEALATEQEQRQAQSKVGDLKMVTNGSDEEIQRRYNEIIAILKEAEKQYQPKKSIETAHTSNKQDEGEYYYEVYCLEGDNFNTVINTPSSITSTTFNALGEEKKEEAKHHTLTTSSTPATPLGPNGAVLSPIAHVCHTPLGKGGRVSGASCSPIITGATGGIGRLGSFGAPRASGASGTFCTLECTDSPPDLVRSTPLLSRECDDFYLHRNHGVVGDVGDLGEEAEEAGMEEGCELMELKNGIGYWNERGELILESDGSQVGGDRGGNGRTDIHDSVVSGGKKKEDQFVKRFFNDGGMGEDDDSEGMMMREEEHDSNDEGYDGNDYPEDQSYTSDNIEDDYPIFSRFDGGMHNTHTIGTTKSKYSTNYGSDSDYDDYMDADAHRHHQIRYRDYGGNKGFAGFDSDEDSEEDGWKIDFRNRFVSGKEKEVVEGEQDESDGNNEKESEGGVNCEQQGEESEMESGIPSFSSQRRMHGWEYPSATPWLNSSAMRENEGEDSDGEYGGPMKGDIEDGGGMEDGQVAYDPYYDE